MWMARIRMRAYDRFGGRPFHDALGCMFSYVRGHWSITCGQEIVVVSRRGRLNFALQVVIFCYSSHL